jgi:hypothetical protein
LCEPNCLPKELADRTVFIVAKTKCRIVGDDVARTRGKPSDWRWRRKIVGAAMIATLMATRIVPLTGQQMQTFPHRRHTAKEDGEHPSKSDSPNRAHGKSIP